MNGGWPFSLKGDVGVQCAGSQDGSAITFVRPRWSQSCFHLDESMRGISLYAKFPFFVFDILLEARTEKTQLCDIT